MVSDNDNEIVSEAQKEVERQKTEPRKKFEANVFENIDASTGYKIDEQSIDTLSQSAIKEAED